jgi:hypothetical protein
MGNLEGGGALSPGNGEIGRGRFWERRVCFYQALRGKPEGAFFSGNLERYIKRALEMEHLSLCRGSVRGTWKGGVIFWGL